MKTVTIRQLHAKTGEVVRQASRHGQILVTDNGRTIAKYYRKTAGPGFRISADANFPALLQAG